MIAKEKLNILWSLEQTAEKYADRVAVSDVNQELTWKELVKKAQVIGAELIEKVQPGNPVPVLLEKSSETLAVMLGIVYAGYKSRSLLLNIFFSSLPNCRICILPIGSW